MIDKTLVISITKTVPFSHSLIYVLTMKCCEITTGYIRGALEFTKCKLYSIGMHFGVTVDSNEKY